MAKDPPKNHTQEDVVDVLPGAQPAATAAPAAEEIERLAHEYWLERGSPIGTPEEDWFRAEDEIRLRRQQPGQKDREGTQG